MEDTDPDTVPASAPKGVLLKADTIAEPFLAEVKASLANTVSRLRVPKLAGILATTNAPSRSYAEFTRRQCVALGIEFELREVGPALMGSEAGGANEGSADGDGVEEAIIEANADDSVDGIMVYYPIFGKEQVRSLVDYLGRPFIIVSPFKDVEGLNYKFHYNLYHNIRYLEPKSLLALSPSLANSPAPLKNDVPPPGTVKSILPCTPLGVVKSLERIGVYNALLPYGDRAYGRIITVINRSEVVGRPLAALLANDGARVFSVDIDSIQEYTKRPAASSSSSGGEAGRTAAARRAFHPRHVVHAVPPEFDLARCLAISDVVVSAVPSAAYKVPTAALKDGCVCVNVAADKNFEADVRDKASLYIPAVGKVTILMLLRNLLRLLQYQDLLKEAS